MNKNNLKEATQPKKTSISGKMRMVKFSSMNKHKKKSYKVYRGQGK
jgi:hypothetical protein